MESIDETTDVLTLALERAFREPALLPDFYRALLRADLFLVGRSDQPSGSERRHRITLMQWETESGERIIPVFSSLDELHRSIGEDEQVLRMGATQLLTLGTSLPLVVDPLSDHQTVLSPGDVQALASGRLPGVDEIDESVESSRSAPLSQAVPAPVDPAAAQLIDALITLLARRPGVRRAWLCQVPRLESSTLTDETDHVPNAVDDTDTDAVAVTTVLALDMDAEHAVAPVFEDVTCVIGQSTGSASLDALDVVALGDDQWSQQLREQVAPFYDRQWGARMTDPLLVGHA